MKKFVFYILSLLIFASFVFASSDGEYCSTYNTSLETCLTCCSTYAIDCYSTQSGPICVRRPNNICKNSCYSKFFNMDICPTWECPPIGT